MNLISRGRELGYTAQQVRRIVEEQKSLIEREKRMKEVLDCNSVEDLKILLLDWLDKGFVK